MNPGQFGWALAKMHDGEAVARRGWNGQGMWLSICGGDSAMNLPYIYLSTKDGFVPWVASQTDLLADDWYDVVEG